MTTFGERGIVLGGHIDCSVAGTASTGTAVRTIVVVQHKIPNDDALAPAGDICQAGIFHLVEQRYAHVVTVIPGTDGRLGEIEVLLRCGIMHGIELGSRSAVVMVSRSVDVLGCLRVVVDLNRIALLVLFTIVVIVMVKDDDLGLQASRLKCRTEGSLDKVTLLLPRHIERHRVPPVEGFVLNGHAGDRHSGLLEALDPFDEIGGIVLIIVGIEIASYP